MKKGVPQPSFEEGAQKLPYDTGQYLVSWLHLAARETDVVFILHGHVPSYKCYFYGRKIEQRLADSYQSATLPLLCICIFHFLV